VLDCSCLQHLLYLLCYLIFESGCISILSGVVPGIRDIVWSQDHLGGSSEGDVKIDWNCCNNSYTTSGTSAETLVCNLDYKCISFTMCQSKTPGKNPCSVI
jgi:hypothetical protein